MKLLVYTCTHMVKDLALSRFSCMLALPNDIHVSLDKSDILLDNLLRHEHVSMSSQCLKDSSKKSRQFHVHNSNLLAEANLIAFLNLVAVIRGFIHLY